MDKDKNKNTKFMKNLVISFSTVLIIILIMGVNLYNLSIKNVRYEIRNQNKLILQNAINDIDASFRTMDALAAQIATNSNIVHLANKEDNNDSEFYMLADKAKDDLSVYLHTENMLPINTYFIYLQQPGYILSFSQFEDTSIYYSGKEKLKQELYQDWLSMMNNQENYRKFLPIDSYKNNVSGKFMYILSLKNFSLRKIPATICFEIDLVKLNNIFGELNFFHTGYLHVANGKGERIFTVKDDKTGSFDDKKLKSLNFENGFAKYGSGSHEMFVTNIESTFNQWDYYFVQPSDASLYSLEHYRNIFIIIIFVALVIGFGLIIILSKTNVKPIILLDNQLKDTITKQKSLQEVIDTQKPIIQKSYLNKIMEGGIASTDELNYAIQYLNLSTENKKFSVLYISVYVNQYELYVENSVITGPDSDNYDEILTNAFSVYFDEPIYISHPSERGYVLLLSSQQDEKIDVSSLNVENAFKSLHAYLLENHSIWAIAGLGNWNNSLMITWKSYQQAGEAVSYASKKHIFRNYLNIKRDTSVFYYPMELVGKLINFITSGNESQVLEIFEVIRYENMEERDLPINMMKFLLSDICNTLLKIKFNIPTDEKSMDVLQEIDENFKEPRSMQLFQNIATKLCGLYSNKSSNNQIIANIKEYIKDNYKDPCLSLSKISTEFSISESYFSYLFKEETGENFSVYLEGIRMEQALKLLKVTDVNISDLYQEVGYNNSNTFRRAFKKIYGVSPKTLRETVSNKPEL